MKAALSWRELASQGLTVSPVGLGCMGMTDTYGRANEAESIATIRHAVDIGVTLFDTAEAYGPFTNERLLAKALGSDRPNIHLATKTGIEISDDGQFLGLNGSPAYVRKSLERSLRNLRTDYVDLFYLHRLDPKVPVEETIGAMADLVREGKVRFIGLSEVSAKTIERAHAVHPIAAVQTEYSLFERSIEQNGVLAALTELKIGLVAYAPMGRGILSGKMPDSNHLEQNDWRRTDPRFSADNFVANRDRIREFEKLAAQKNITPAQLALAWILRQGHVAIPGTKRISYLEENLAAKDVRLSDQDLADIESNLPRGFAKGERYSSEAMEWIDE